MRTLTGLSLLSALLLSATGGHATSSMRPLIVTSPIVAQSPSLAAKPGLAAKAVVEHVVPAAKKLELSEAAPMRAAKAGALHIVKLQQRHRGIPVLNRGAGVALRPDGTAAFATIQLEEKLPATVVPTIGAARAAEIATRLTKTQAKATDARLVIGALPSGARLAWLIVPSGRTAGIPHAPVVLLDAEDGTRLAGWDAVRTANARVYEANPVSTPGLIDVRLPLEDGATSLTNERVISYNCIDRKETKKYQGINVRICHLEQKASADADGDFLEKPAPDAEAEDAFAEISIFHHVNRAYDFFTGLGMVPLPQRISTVSNLRFADGFFSGDTTHIGDKNRPLLPYQNAFYVSGGTMFSEIFDVDGPGLWFGQGPRRDYSYDGDVVYHELGHAVVDHTIALPFWFRADDQGLVPAGGAMNEGLADYFAAVISGDPIIGEYAIGDLGMEDAGLKGIRDISVSESCPANLSGEVHADSVFFSAGLWSLRSSLPRDDRPLFDQAVFDAMTIGHGDIGYEDFGNLLLASVKASPLGESVADAVRAELTARGILPACKRQLPWKGEPIDSTDLFSQNSFWAPGTNDAFTGPLPYAPGVVQFQVPLEQTGHLTIQFEKLDTGPAVAIPFRPQVLIRWGSEPIGFTWSPTLDNDADVDVKAKRTASGFVYRAHAQVPAEVSQASVMIVNTGEESGHYKQVSFSFESEVGDELPPDIAASDGYAQRKDEGCGCEAPGSAPGGGAWLSGAALLAAIAWRRRRA